jgi:hypothetical protein
VDLPKAPTAERRKHVQTKDGAITAVRRGFDLDLDHLEPLLRVLAHGQISLDARRTRGGKKASGLGSLSERLVFAGEERSSPNPD